MKSLVLRIATVGVVAVAAASVGLCAKGKPKPKDQAKPKPDYDTLFGVEERKVKATPSTTDDVAFAAKLLAAAKATTDPPELRVKLLEKAYELSIRRSSGYAQAIQATDLLARVAPERQTECLHKKLEVLRLGYVKASGPDRKKAAVSYLEALVAAGDAKLANGQATEARELYRRAYSLASYLRSRLADEVRRKMPRVAVAVATERKITMLKRTLKMNPASVKAREALIMAYVLELDRPSLAVGLLTDDLDDGLRRNVSLAAKSASRLGPSSCLTLARWYDSLAERHLAPETKLPAYRRAREYYRRYLLSASRRSSTAARARLALARINKAIDKLDPDRLTLDLGGGVALTLVRAPAGVFLMGSPSDEPSRGSDEGPQHTVRFAKPFYIGITEVTQRQYQAVMGENPSAVKRSSNPVENVSLDQASAFCSKLGLRASRNVRLPTEAEWEYACRAGSRTAFCFGNGYKGLDYYSWNSRNSGGKPHPVAGKRPNAWGIHDMHGNVREYVLSPYSSSSYAGAAGIDPQSSAVCKSPVQRRGGSALRSTSLCRSANRMTSGNDGEPGTGFRAVVEVE